MGGVETITHSGMYWAVTVLIAVIVAAAIGLSWRRARERGAMARERDRLGREASLLQARVESQQHELDHATAQLADRAQRLEEQAKTLADLQQDRDARAAELARANRHLDAKLAELARANRQLEAQSAEIARANGQHVELLANLSQDLRTPLNSALILSKLLADNGSGNLTPEQVKFAQTIYSAGNNLLELLNDLLDLSKIEAGTIEIHRQPLAIAALVARLQHTVGPMAEQKRVDLAIRLAPDLPEALHSDAQRLPQVLKNLLATAIKLTDRGTVSLDIQSSGADLDFTVRAADAVNGRAPGGTGLGLSLARELAPLLGGRIEVWSEAGQASTFRFIVPINARMMASAPARVGAGG